MNLLIGCASGPGEDADRAARERGEAATELYRNRDDRLSVAVPPGWRVAREVLTPRLVNPKEILSLGTFPMPPGGRTCAHVPGRALASLRPSDAFVSIQERGGEAGGAPPREEVRLTHLPGAGLRSDTAACSDGPVRFDDSFVAFEDSGRVFHALVAVGRAASTQTRREARTILESLEFE